MGRAEEEQPLAAPEELAAQKREQRLRKFRELHLKRVSNPDGPPRLVPGRACARLWRDEEGSLALLTDPQLVCPG